MFTSIIRCGWRTAAVSEAGVSHIQNGVDCQDSSLVHVGTKWLIACVADGAGSAIHSKEGSRTAVESFVEVAADLLRCRYDPETTVRNAFDQARLGVSKISGCETQKYATTLLGLVATRNRVAAAQVGDGAIIIDGQVVLKGHAGEYANETSFITQDEVAPQLFVSKRKVRRVALITDGLEHLALQRRGQERRAHRPFFNSMYRWLRKTKRLDRNEQLSDFLRSDMIRSRTGDDVTLLLAMR